MAMSASPVSVDANGNETLPSNSLATDIYNGMKTLFTNAGITMTTAIKQGLPGFANMMASSIVNHITANAAVTVTVHTTDTGLQTTPNPNNPNTATLGPTANKTITGGTIA